MVPTPSKIVKGGALHSCVVGFSESVEEVVDRVHELDGEWERGAVIGGREELVREVADSRLELSCCVPVGLNAIVVVHPVC